MFPQDTARGVYYKIFERDSKVANRELESASSDIKKRYNLVTSFVAEWMLVVTWNRLEYPGKNKQVRQN